MMSNSLTPNSGWRNQTTEPTWEKTYMVSWPASGQDITWVGIPSLAVHESTTFNINFQVPIQATGFALVICTVESEIYYYFSLGDSDTLTGLRAIHIGHRNWVENQKSSQSNLSFGMRIRKEQRSKSDLGGSVADNWERDGSQRIKLKV